MEVIIYGSDGAAKQALATDMLRSLLQQLREDEPRPVVLPTGTTFESRNGKPGVYELLAGMLLESGTDISGLPLANMDAYLRSNGNGRLVLLDPDDARGYQYYMREQLWERLGIVPKNHVFPLPDAEEWSHGPGTLCKGYSNWLTDHGRPVCVYGGLGSPVVHLAFNGRGSTVNSPARVVELSLEERMTNAQLYGRSLDEISPYAATIGHVEIMTADRLVIAAFGARKANAVFRALEGNDDDLDCPASEVISLHPCVTLILDEEAASKLPKKSCYRRAS